jgi:hypothetical protein
MAQRIPMSSREKIEQTRDDGTTKLADGKSGGHQTQKRSGVAR